MNIERTDSKYLVTGAGSGWINNKTFDTKWKTDLAIKIFNEGGSFSDYFIKSIKAEGRRRKTKKTELIIVKYGSKYFIHGGDDEWLSKDRTYQRKWMARLSIEVYFQGGDFSDYKKEAEVIAKTRKEGRLHSSQKSFIKVICPNCNYVEVPVTHEDCITGGHIVIGRILYRGKDGSCEECGMHINRSNLINKSCKKCGYKFIAGLIEVYLPI